MQKIFVDYLSCPVCKGNSFQIVIKQQNTKEIREGEICCNICQSKFAIKSGVLDVLANPGPVIKKQQEGTIHHEMAPWGLPFRPCEAAKYKKQILSLPDEDDSNIFKKETSFRSIAESAPAFYQGLLLGLRGKEKLLDLGADICWSTNKFAQIGCQCVALDINYHLEVSDIYIYENNVYFERVRADMDYLPFIDQSFDVVVTMTSIHHATDLRQTFKEISRVLTSSGRVILINEPVRGIFQPKKIGREIEKKLNLNDKAYTPWEYYSAAKRAGLKLRFEPSFSSSNSSNLIKKMIKSFLIKRPRTARLFTKLFTKIPLPIFPFKVIMVAQKY